MTDEECGQLESSVYTAAKNTYLKWEDVLSVDDIAQEIWLRILEDGRKQLDVLLGMDYKARVSTLRKVGDRICSKERDDYETFSGNYLYGVDEVKEMLERGALGEDANSRSPWDMSSDEIEALGRPDSEVTNERIDLFLALKSLGESNARHGYLLVLKYRDGHVFDNAEPDRYACDRAVESLTKEMNRIAVRRSAKFEGPGKYV